MKVTFGGDAMLGRLVAETMQTQGPDYPLEAVADVFRSADLGVVNLECAVTSNPARWAGPKAFYFRADPTAAPALARAGIGAVSVANNHALDFGREGLVEMLELLAHEGIATFGAGRNRAEATRPALVPAGDLSVGFIGFTDHPAEFAADEYRAGVAYLDVLGDPEGSLVEAVRALERSQASGADLTIVSLHWGPNFDGEPQPELVRFAHGLIDAGADMIFGHSAHELMGIEVYRGHPILYGAGDLVDDYYVGDRENDRTAVYTVTWNGRVAERLEVSPCFIRNCRVAPASPPMRDVIARRLVDLSARLGTTLRREGELLVVDCTPDAQEQAPFMKQGQGHGQHRHRSRAGLARG